MAIVKNEDGLIDFAALDTREEFVALIGMAKREFNNIASVAPEGSDAKTLVAGLLVSLDGLAENVGNAPSEVEVASVGNVILSTLYEAAELVGYTVDNSADPAIYFNQPDDDGEDDDLLAALAAILGGVGVRKTVDPEEVAKLKAFRAVLEANAPAGVTFRDGEEEGDFIANTDGASEEDRKAFAAFTSATINETFGGAATRPEGDALHVYL